MSQNDKEFQKIRIEEGFCVHNKFRYVLRTEPHNIYPCRVEDLRDKKYPYYETTVQYNYCAL